MSRAIKCDWPHSAIVDDDKFEELSKFDWYISISNGKPYARRHTQKSRPVGETWMHRLIVNCPLGKITHHKNGHTMDNRIKNLQKMTQEEHEQLRRSRKFTLLKPNCTHIHP